MWFHPIVLRADGTLAYDAFGGSWGDLAGLDRLREKYLEETDFSQKVEEQARLLGWAVERNAMNELVVHHPSGGSLTIAAGGQLTAQGFVGGACHQAREQLGLEVDGIVNTAEACQVPAAVNLGSE